MNTLSRTNLGLNQQTYQRLKAALRLNLRRQVFIGVCDNLVLRDRLAAQLQDDLLYRSNSPTTPHPSQERTPQGASARPLRNYPRLVSLYLDVNNPDPLAGVAQWLSQHQANTKRRRLPMPAFQLLGVEQLSRQPATIQWLFLNYLQGIERSLPALDSSLLIWIPRPWARMIPQSAPDFWRCRTAVFEFAGDPTPLTFTISPEPTYSAGSQGEWSASNSSHSSSPIDKPINESVSESINESANELVDKPSNDMFVESDLEHVGLPAQSEYHPSVTNHIKHDQDFDDFDASLEDLVSTAEFPPEDALIETSDESDRAESLSQSELADTSATTEVAEIADMPSDNAICDTNDNLPTSSEGLKLTENSEETESPKEAEDEATSEMTGVSQIDDGPPDLPEDTATSEMPGASDIANDPDLPEDAIASEMAGVSQNDDGTDLPEDTATSEMTGVSQNDDGTDLPEDAIATEIPGTPDIDQSAENLSTSGGLESSEMPDGSGAPEAEALASEEPMEECTDVTQEPTTRAAFLDQEATTEDLNTEDLNTEDLNTEDLNTEELRDTNSMEIDSSDLDGSETGDVVVETLESNVADLKALDHDELMAESEQEDHPLNEHQLLDSEDIDEDLLEEESPIAAPLSLKARDDINDSFESGPQAEDISPEAQPAAEDIPPEAEPQTELQVDTDALVDSSVPTLFDLHSTDESLLDIVDDASLLDTVDEASLLDYYDYDDDEEETIVSPSPQAPIEDIGQELEQEKSQYQGDRPSPIPTYTPSTEISSGQSSENNSLKNTVQDLSKLLNASLETTQVASESTGDNSVLGLTGFDVLDSLDRITDNLLNDEAEEPDLMPQTVDERDNDDERDNGQEQDVFPAVLLEGLASVKPRDEHNKSQNLAPSTTAFAETQTDTLGADTLDPYASESGDFDSDELDPDELDADILEDDLDLEPLISSELSLGTELELDSADGPENALEHGALSLDDDSSTSLDVGALIKGLETDDAIGEEDFSYSDPWSARLSQLEDATVSATGDQATGTVDNDADTLEQPALAEELEISDAHPGFLTPDLFAPSDDSANIQELNVSPGNVQGTDQETAPDFEIFDPSDPAVQPLLQRIADLQHQRSEKRILAEAYRNLGNLYRDRIEQQGDVSPQNLIRAMQAYKQVLGGIDDSHPMWAEVLNDMGNLCWLLSRGAPSPEQGLPHLLQGIQAYRMALTKIDPKAEPQTYPMVQNNLGAAYGDLARYQDPVVNLQNSIHAYQEALLYRSIDREPLRYASTQNNLGTTYWNLAQHVEPTDNLKQAIESYSEALRLYRPDTDPLNYAMIQNNLGTTYWNLAQHEQSGDWLRLAIMAYETALKFRTMETNPSAFAATQNNLGTAYWHVATYVEEDTEAKLAALQNAIKAYDAALSAVEVLEYQQHPAPLNFDVLATHNNLGLVQYQISTEPDIQAIYSDNHGYLDQAIDHHLLALQGWQGRPELRQTALGCVIQTLQAIYNQKGLTAQNLALSKIPGQMLPEIMPKL